MYCLSQFCRICINNDGNLVNLHNVDSDLLTYYDKLKYCNSKNICEETILLNFICESCCKKLQKTFKFLKLCLNSEHVLKKYMNQLENASTFNKNYPEKLADLMDKNYKELLDLTRHNEIAFDRDKHMLDTNIEIEAIKLEPLDQEDSNADDESQEERLEDYSDSSVTKNSSHENSYDDKNITLTSILYPSVIPKRKRGRPRKNPIDPDYQLQTKNKKQHKFQHHSINPVKSFGKVKQIGFLTTLQSQQANFQLCKSLKRRRKATLLQRRATQYNEFASRQHEMLLKSHVTQNSPRKNYNKHSARQFSEFLSQQLEVVPHSKISQNMVEPNEESSLVFDEYTQRIHEATQISNGTAETTCKETKNTYLTSSVPNDSNLCNTENNCKVSAPSKRTNMNDGSNLFNIEAMLNDEPQSSGAESALFSTISCKNTSNSQIEITPIQHKEPHSQQESLLEHRTKQFFSKSNPTTHETKYVAFSESSQLEITPIYFNDSTSKQILPKSKQPFTLLPELALVDHGASVSERGSNNESLDCSLVPELLARAETAVFIDGTERQPYEHRLIHFPTREMKKDTRRKCRGCYRKRVNEQGRQSAMNCKKVSTICDVCGLYLCVQCFNEVHNFEIQ